MRSKASAPIFAMAVLSAALLATLIAACVSKEEGPLVPEDYRAWTRWPEEPLRYPIPGHLSNARVVFMNELGFQVEVTPDGDRLRDDYPEGTIIIKEVHTGLEADVDAEPAELTVMVKSPDHELALGGWIWLRKDPRTGQESIIDYALCVDCHADANEPHPYGDENPRGEFRDYVFFPFRSRAREP